MLTVSAVNESWADSFHFTEDLEALEAIYQEEQRASLKRQAQTRQKHASQAPKVSPEVPVTAVEAEADDTDARFLDQLADKIAERLAQRITASDTFKVHELERDNAQMAAQIRELLDKVHRLELEAMVMQQEAQTYHHIAGPLYYKR